MIRKESDGKHFDPHTGKREPVYCPVNGWDCPYYEKGICYIRDPMEDCDDWVVQWSSWKEWEDAQHPFNFILIKQYVQYN